ncbi:MAG: hypothetical protein QME48_07595 [bacterium]|uniref:Uncharacterized protein n=2 Tax=Bacteria candidate phyla TaxID=1783234 RepID=A0A101I3Z8_UNCT6|nr:MAG: hypothetical protein XD76_0780 [candidate division TA06 bacterium 32_111]KUK88268.1 MAG: hypothetical protein XE03_0274 [candidate division TA06 bacterium 34_109]MDI6701073.1 hypothetical protein [bacterium]HAF07201.1 hypothetical protein [candidate division WOR-3 bacterium]HCP16052.1 hypothetical protein [candidate division WOR-3 bacterium]
MDILNYSSYQNEGELLKVKEFSEIAKKSLLDKDMRAILIKPSKVIKNSENFLFEDKVVQLGSIFVKHTFLNETDVTTFLFDDEENFEEYFLKSFYSSLKYSFLDIPFGGSTLGLIVPKDLSLSNEKVKRKLSSLLVKNFSDILNEQNYLKIKEDDREKKDFIIKLIENIDKPRISKKFKFLLKNPLRKKIIKEKYEALWLKSFVKYFYKKDRVRVIIDSINLRSFNFLKEILNDGYFVVIGFGEKNYSYYSPKGIDCKDIAFIENRETNEKCIDYVDLLKKETDLFLEFGGENNFNETMAKIVKCGIYCEFEDLSTSFQSVKFLKNRNIIYLPSLLLDCVDEIFDYFEVIERKREEVMSVDEIELRMETYVNFVISYFDSFLENQWKVFESVLLRSFENYRKKFSLVYG